MERQGLKPEPRRSSGRAGRRSALLACAVVAWEILGRSLELRTDVLPTPSRVILEAWRQGPELRQHLLSTLSGAAAGLCLALLAAVPAGFLSGSSAGGLRLVRQVVASLRMMPLLALLPIFLVWFGYGTLPRLAMVFLTSFLPLLASAAAAGDSIPGDMLDLFRAMGASRTQTALRLRIPLLLSELLGTLRGASVTALSVAVTAEFVEAEEGIGYLMLSAISRLNTPLLFASFLSIAFVGIAVWISLGALRRALAPWYVERNRAEWI